MSYSYYCTVETCAYCILVSYSWQPPIITPVFQKVHVFLCHILGNLVLLHCILKHVLIVFLCHILGNLLLLHHILKGACILVSYPWQPRIIAPYSETCAYCILVSYSWQPRIIALYSKKVHVFLCHILGNLVLAYCIILGNLQVHVLIVFLCHILGNLVLLHHIPKGVHILVSYSIQTHIIAPCSDGCTHSYVILLVWYKGTS